MHDLEISQEGNCEKVANALKIKSHGDLTSARAGLGGLCENPNLAFNTGFFQMLIIVDDFWILQGFPKCENGGSLVLIWIPWIISPKIEVVLRNVLRIYLKHFHL